MNENTKENSSWGALKRTRKLGAFTTTSKEEMEKTMAEITAFSERMRKED